MRVVSFQYTCAPTLTYLSTSELVKTAIFFYRACQVYCGDFIFSGHTMILVTSYLTLKQYTPGRLFILHWASLAVAVAGAVVIFLPTKFIFIVYECQRP